MWEIKNFIWEDYAEDKFWDLDSQYVSKGKQIPLIKYSLGNSEKPLIFEERVE